MTTRTKLNTILGIQWREGEVVFHHDVQTPEALRLWLSPILGRLREQQTHAKANATGIDRVEQLERLVALFDRGVLTEDEFAAAKRGLLSDAP